MFNFFLRLLVASFLYPPLPKKEEKAKQGDINRNYLFFFLTLSPNNVEFLQQRLTGCFLYNKDKISLAIKIYPENSH